MSELLARYQGCLPGLAAGDAVGAGYCVQRLKTALWCFVRDSDFEKTILLATNLGDDADTTAAIAGQLAASFYGVSGIPQTWRDKLWQYEDIDTLARKLLAKSA